MSVLTMYPVQSMRKFVCDRLTAAAQEILGAFEKRVEDYEAELARQRRMLDTVFSPEIKLQRAEIKALLNQQQHGNNDGASRLLPDTAQIKDELEEISISQERTQPPQQQAPTSRVPEASDPNTSGDQSQPFGPEKQFGTNKNPSFNSSSKDVQSGSEKGTLPVSEQTLSGNSGEAQTQNYNRQASPAEPREPTSSERRPELATNPEETFDDAFLDTNYEDIFNEIDDNAFALSGMSPDASLNMSFDDLNVTPASITELTQSEKVHVERPILTVSTELTQAVNAPFTITTTSKESGTYTGDCKISLPGGNCDPEANKIQEENSVLAKSVDPAQPEEIQSYRAAFPILTVLTPHDKNKDAPPAPSEGGDERRTFMISNIHDESATPSESAQLSPNEKHRDVGATSAGNVEQKSDKKNDSSASSTKSTEHSLNQGNIKESSPSADRKEPASKKKHKDRRTSAHKNTEPSLKKKSKDGKTSTSEMRLHIKHRQESARSAAVKTLSSTSVDNTSHSALEQSQGSDSEKMTANESADQVPNIKACEEKETSKASSNSSLNDDVDTEAVSTGDTFMAQDDSSEKTPPGDGKKAASPSKSKHKSSDQDPKLERSIKKTPVRKSHNEDANSKEATSPKRPKASQGSESPQKKMHKDEGSTSSRGSQRKKQDKSSKENTSDQNSDPPLSHTDDSESSDGEEKVENPYKCDRCGKVMSNFKNYKFHMKSHTVAKTYKCDTCGKMFRESWDLNKHLVIHAAEKPYKCDVCGNGFNRRYNLDLHARVHTGEKPYQCKTCGKSFSSCVNMKKHMRIHTGEKPYTCKECGKEFADSSAFKNHLRVHTGEKPFKCSYCKRKFATRTTLKRHIRTHTGEKPYKCTICDRNFGHRTDLKGHMRMHTGEKPYKCTTCGEEFSTWSKLNKHKRAHSGEAQDSTE